MFKNSSKGLKLASQESIAGYLFILPFLAGFILMIVIPLILAILLSFTNIRYLNLWRETRFVGLDNFINMFKDEYAIDSLIKSFKYAIMFIPSVIISGFIFALLINVRLYIRNVLRTMLFLPYVSNIAAIALVWSMLLDPSDGPVNRLLKAIGMKNPPLWLVGSNTALATSAFIVVWTLVGFYFITFLAALQGVPIELYEASTIDGAGFFGKLLNVTLPSISETTFFLVITAIIMAFQNFGPIYVLTGGGPGDASKVLAINIYSEAFLNSRISYANSQAVIVFLVLIIITRLLWRFQNKKPA